ncbi:hypothetical protein G7Y79_00062g093550 [Physcia stellaris]|nr:hypothetical protein G7Y79_00062g093550 [Physcia stellaris]
MAHSETPELVKREHTTVMEVPKNLDDEYSGSYIHSSLEERYDPKLGRSMHASTSVAAGTVLIIDSPDVVWCDDHCFAADQTRHSLECAWLKANGAKLRRSEGEYNFTMLWLVVRTLIERYLEFHDLMSRERQDHTVHEGFTRGWDSIQKFRGNRSIMPQERLEYWTYLIQTYASDAEWSPALTCLDEILSTICQEEMNSFWLYSTILPAFPPLPSAGKLDNPYGLGMYPWATRCNHSCVPNVVFKANGRNQMVLVTDRDISSGEEIRIPYVDFVEYATVRDRRKRLKDLFLFDCACERCLDESAQGEAGT